MLLTLNEAVEGDDTPSATIQLYGGREALVDSVELWVDGTIVQTFAAERGGGLLLSAQAQISGGRYALAVARGPSWAVSAPVWLDVPAVDTAAAE